MPFMGALKLQHLCTGLLIDFRDCLEDVGDTPLELLQPVLLQCNAEQLASIEDGTRSGGRDLREALQPHWHRVFVNDFGGWNRDSDQELQHASKPRTSGAATRNWRQLYKLGQERLKQKAAGLGKRLRAMTQAEVQSRQTKHVTMIEAPRSLKRHKSSIGNSKEKIQIIPARQRVLSKLGLLHSNSLKHLIQIRPPNGSITQAINHQLQGSSTTPAKVSMCGLPQRESPQQPVGLKLSVSRSRGSATEPTVGSIARQPRAIAGTAAVPAMKSVTCPSAGNLVEDEIDWMTSNVPPAGRIYTPQTAEQPWTVQFLEADGDNAVVVHTAPDSRWHHGHRPAKASVSQQQNRLLDKAAVKHGTCAWVEDDIEWD